MTTARRPASLSLAVVTTPRRDSLVGIVGFLRFVREWRRKEPRICAVVVAMPSQTAASVREQIIALLEPGEHLAEMAPAAGDCGPIFEFACECGFRLAPEAAVVLHVPIDVAWGEIHEFDVQLQIFEMSAILDMDGTGLLLGDYTPAAWRNGKPEPHVTKELTGGAVREQLEHYGLDAV